MSLPRSEEKKATSEIVAYRESAINTTLAGVDEKALYWRVAEDEVTNFYYQKKIFTPPKNPFSHELASRTAAHFTYSSTKQFEWMFPKHFLISTPAAYYRYWIARSAVETSSHFTREIKTLRLLVHRSPEAEQFVQKALNEFQNADSFQKKETEEQSLEKMILAHRAKTVAFTAAYLAALKIQFLEAKKKGEQECSYFFNKAAHCTEQTLLLRKKILAATQQGEEKKALLSAIAALSWNNVTECYQKVIACILSKNRTSFFLFNQTSQAAEQAAIRMQCLLEKIATTPNATKTILLERAFFLLKNSNDYKIQILEPLVFFHDGFIPLWKKAAALTEQAAHFWQKAAHSMNSYGFSKIITPLWKIAAYDTEYKAQATLLTINARNNIHFAQHTLKEPASEKKRYHQEIIKAALADQEALARSWRLAADAANTFYFQHALTPSLHEDWKLFIKQFSLKKVSPLLLFLHGAHAVKKSWMFVDDEGHEAAASYRYWVARSVVKEKPESIEQIIFYHYQKKEQLAEAYFIKLKQQAVTSLSSDQGAIQATLKCAEDSFSLRKKATEATFQKKEREAIEYTLAAYTTNQLGEGHQKFFDLPVWKKIAALGEQGVEYRLKALKISTTEKKHAATCFRRAAFLLETIFEYTLENLASATSCCDEVIDQARRAAALWSECGALNHLTLRSWEKFLLKRAAQRAEKEMRETFFLFITKKIFFCLPYESVPDAHCKKAWSEGRLFPSIEFTAFHSWIYQTWNLFQQAGMNYNLSTELLEQGTVITWGFFILKTLGMEQKLPATTFLVDILADRLPHPGAHLYLTQNRTYAKYFPHTYFIPHWPQRSLIPRDSKRGTRFENVAFFGDPTNFAPELQTEEWREWLLKELGITFFLQGNTGWHDYRAIDAIVALRDLSHSRHLHKPATKLYNAWLAGVPFIGGRDAAYAAEGNPGKDYLVATSLEEIFQHLKRLKEDVAFRSQLVENGRISGTAFTQEATMKRWKKLTEEIIPAHALQWQKKSALQRRWFFFVNRMICLVNYLLQ